MFAIKFSWCYFGEFGIGSANNPLIDFFPILITCMLNIVLILLEEIEIFLGHSSELKGYVCFYWAQCYSFSFSYLDLETAKEFEPNKDVIDFDYNFLYLIQ